MNVNLLKLLNKLQNSNNKNNIGLSLNNSIGLNSTFSLKGKATTSQKEVGS